MQPGRPDRPGLTRDLPAPDPPDPNPRAKGRHKVPAEMPATCPKRPVGRPLYGLIGTGFQSRSSGLGAGPEDVTADPMKRRYRAPSSQTHRLPLRRARMLLPIITVIGRGARRRGDIWIGPVTWRWSCLEKATPGQRIPRSDGVGIGPRSEANRRPARPSGSLSKSPDAAESLFARLHVRTGERRPRDRRPRP